MSQKINLSLFLSPYSVPARFEDGEKFEVQRVRRGESASLRCNAQGDAPITILWHKDKEEVDFEATALRYHVYETKTEKGFTSELLIRMTERVDGALFKCVARNNYGQDEKTIKLLIVEVPEPPSDVRINEIWSRSATISWSQPYHGNSEIVKYLLHYWLDDDLPAGSRPNIGHNKRLSEIELRSSPTSYMLKDLQPGTAYMISLTAMNEVGQGEASRPIKLETAEEVPAGPPTDVEVRPQGTDSITVTFKAPLKHLRNGKMKGYYIGFKVSLRYIKQVSIAFSFERLIDSDPLVHRPTAQLLPTPSKQWTYP